VITEKIKYPKSVTEILIKVKDKVIPVQAVEALRVARG
jgi:hypothetical protein